MFRLDQHNLQMVIFPLYSGSAIFPIGCPPGHLAQAAVLPVPYTRRAPPACSSSEIPAWYIPIPFAPFCPLLCIVQSSWGTPWWQPIGHVLNSFGNTEYFWTKQTIIILRFVGGAHVQNMTFIQVGGHLPAHGPFSNGCKVPSQDPHRFIISGINPQLTGDWCVKAVT